MIQGAYNHDLGDVRKYHEFLSFVGEKVFLLLLQTLFGSTLTKDCIMRSVSVQLPPFLANDFASETEHLSPMLML